MFSRNNLLIGILIGCIAPGIAWVIFELLLHNDSLIMDKPGVPYLIAIGINLLVIRYTFKNEMENTAKGIAIVTFAVMLAVFLLKINIR